MDRKDWTLLVVAQGKLPLQPVQLQKSLFLLSRNLTSSQLQTKSFYEFDPYDYGPFCGSVYSDAEDLETAGLVAIQRPPESRYNHYGITDLGLQKAQSIESKLDKNALEYLKKVVQFTQSVSFNQLVSAIYTTYPDMKANSAFRG